MIPRRARSRHAVPGCARRGTGDVSVGRTTGATGIALQALPLMIWPMLVASLVCLVSGLVLSLYSRYGVIRYWWVAIKFAINVVFSTLIVFALWPGVSDAAEHGRNLAAGIPDGFTFDQIIYPPIVSPTGLVLAVLLGGYKPWGRIRGRVRGGARPAGRAA